MVGRRGAPDPRIKGNERWKKEGRRERGNSEAGPVFISGESGGSTAAPGFTQFVHAKPDPATF